MSAGQRFEVSFDGDATCNEDATDAPSLLSFVGDVLERESSTAAPPSEPRLNNKTGFPAHTKRPITSRFKQKRQDGGSTEGPSADSSTLKTQPSKDLNNSNAPSSNGAPPSEKELIDRENRDRLASMSPAEIEEARRELMSSMDPGLLQRLLRRADIGSGSNEAATLVDEPEKVEAVSQNTPLSRSKKVTFEEADDDDHEEPQQIDSMPHDSIHFPRAPQPPDLDPNSETFFDDLHSKYFPSLPAEPDKLEWMRSSTNGKNTYDPSQTALNPRDIRFDFSGALIAPSVAAAIPVSAGLHHHSDAPDAAGYTIPELSHLSRSTYAPQRCIAFQTLGRILYKLGKGEFGDAGEPGANTVGAEDTMGELARGLWREVETQHVIEHLVAESEGNGIDGGRHISAKAYATEAVWLWRKGGGRRWKAD